MNHYDIYLFDFDGTLFDTKVALRKVYRDCFHAVGIDDITDEECSKFMHHSLLQTAEMRGVPKKDYPAFFEACIASLDEHETVKANLPFPETLEVLEQIVRQGKKIAAVSGNTSKHIRLVLETHGYQIPFQTVVGSDLYKHGKPAPDCLLLAMANMGINPADSVCYVGDSLQDMEAAKRAGIDSILIDRENEHPDYDGVRISSLEELL